MKMMNILLTATLGVLLVSCGTAEIVESASSENPPSEIAQNEEAQSEETQGAEDQEVQTITLNQVPGEFTNGNLKLSTGTYKFEVTNANVDHEVGLVVAPKKEKITEDDHIKSAYVSEMVKTGETQSCQGEVVLEKGEYVYFCPLNPTPQYTIVVE